MAKPESGNVELVAVISQKNNGTFPLVYGPDIEVDEMRLPERLAQIENGMQLDIATENDILALFAAKPTGITTDAGEVTVRAGETATIGYSVQPPEASQDVTAVSGDTGIATVERVRLYPSDETFPSDTTFPLG